MNSHEFTMTANGRVLRIYEGGRARRKMWWAAAIRDDKSDWTAFQRRARLRVIMGQRR